jgi:hypothetical protein
MISYLFLLFQSLLVGALAYLTGMSHAAVVGLVVLSQFFTIWFAVAAVKEASKRIVKEYV